MQNPQDLVDKFIKPWLEKNHPDAAVVFMAGSYGRAMRQGSYQPLKSSDVDLIIVYKDLEKGGFKAATQIFVQEDVGTPMGEGAPRIMMVDTNIHDFASLEYHEKFVREHMGIPFVAVMIDEGFVVKDTTGIAPIMQAEAAKFLQEGPAPRSKQEWLDDISRMKLYLDEIKASDSPEEKRFLGAMALLLVSDNALRVNDFWPGGFNNQAYRSLAKNLPDWYKEIESGFSKLMRDGDSKDAEAILDKCILASARRYFDGVDVKEGMPYPVAQHVPANDVSQIRNVFQKFMTEHVTEALDTSSARGELAYLQTVAAVIYNIKAAVNLRDGDAPIEGKAAIAYLNSKTPDLFPVLMQALDEGLHAPLKKIANDVLSHVGGMHYSRIESYYLEDLARIYAIEPDLKNQPVKTWLKPGYKP